MARALLLFAVVLLTCQADLYMANIDRILEGLEQFERDTKAAVDGRDGRKLTNKDVWWCSPLDHITTDKVCLALDKIQKALPRFEEDDQQQILETIKEHQKTDGNLSALAIVGSLKGCDQTKEIMAIRDLYDKRFCLDMDIWLATQDMISQGCMTETEESGGFRLKNSR